jgi:hypothetical protein
MPGRGSTVGIRRASRATRSRARLALVTVLAVCAAGLTTVVAGAPAVAVQATGDDVPTWANGNSWTYGTTTFNYNDGNGTNVTINETVTYTVTGQEMFNGYDTYVQTITGTINSCSGNANAGGTSVSLGSCSGNVTGVRHVRRSDLALVQENQTQNLSAKADGLVSVTANINLILTPSPTWKIHDFPLNLGDGWTTNFALNYSGGFTYNAGSFGSGSSPFDGSQPFTGPTNVTAANVTVGSTSVPTKRILTTGNDGTSSDDSYYSATYKNDVKEILVLPLSGATMTLNRTLTSASTAPGATISATASPSYTCAGGAVTVSGAISSSAAGQAITGVLDESQVTPGLGQTQSTATGANGAYSLTFTAPGVADALARSGAQPSRGDWGVLLTGPSGAIGATTVVVSNTDCSTIGYTGAVAGPETGTATVSAQLNDLADQTKAAGRTVTFTLSGGATVTAVTNASGVASTTIPVAGPPRATSVSASYAGASDLAAASTSSSFQVTTIGTSTAVVANPSTAIVGDPVTFTATVTPALPSITPAGSVQFSVDGSNFGAPVGLNGSASATSAPISTLPLGFHSVVATYLGSADHAGSTSPAVQFRVRNPLLLTTTTETVTPSVAVAGQDVTLGAHVARASGTDPATGTVTFLDGATVLGSGPVNASGDVTVDLTNVPVGTHSVVASYSGDDTYAASSSAPTGLSIAKADTTVSLHSSDTTTVTGEGVDFTATVAPVAPGAGVPTGNAQLVIDGSNVGAPVALSGGAVAFPAVTSLGAGAHTVAVVYSGDANFRSGADSLVQSVTKADTATVLVSGPNPQVEEDDVTLTATVAPQSPGSGAPTGTVAFFDGTTEIGSAALSPSGGGSQATFTTAFLPVGPHQLTAVYAGDANYNGSDSAAVGQTIVLATAAVQTTTSVTSSLNPSVYGQLIGYTAHVVAADGSAPAGAVQFSIDGTNLGGPVSVDVNGDADSPFISSPEPGDHLVIAAFIPTAAYTASGDTLTQTVQDAGVTVGLTSSNPASSYGQAVTFQATVTSNQVGTGTPGGFVQFRVDGTPLGNAVAVDGTGVATSAATSTLTPGAHTVTAVYSGDVHFLGATRSLGQSVGAIGTTTALAASTTTPTYGDAVTFTATVTPGAGALGAPTGTVTFYDGTTALGTSALAAVGGTGKATFTTATLAGGPHGVKAVYNGSPAFATSTSPVVAVTVAKKPTTLTAQAALIQLNPLLGLNLGFLQAKLTTSAGPLAGQTVVFSIGSSTVCTTTTDATGYAGCNALAQLIPLTLAGGYKVSYAGTGNYASSSATGGLIK